MHHSQASICMSSRTSLPIFLLPSSPTLTQAWETHIHTHTHQDEDMYSQTHLILANSHHTPSGLWSHSGALIISQYLGRGPVIISRVLSSALLSHPDGWVLRPQSGATTAKEKKTWSTWWAKRSPLESVEVEGVKWMWAEKVNWQKENEKLPNYILKEIIILFVFDE